MITSTTTIYICELTSALLPPLSALALLVYGWTEIHKYQSRHRREIQRHKCSDETWQHRTERTRRMFDTYAPDVILWQESKLIVQGWHGGKWRAAWAMAVDAVRRDVDWYVVGPVLRTLCRVNVYHHSLTADGCCDFCDRGWPVEDTDNDMCDCSDGGDPWE